MKNYLLLLLFFNSLYSIAQNTNFNYGFTSQKLNNNLIHTKIGSEISRSGDYVFYIGTDNKVYGIKWNGNKWTGGASPLNSSAPTVKPGNKIVSIGNLVYYVSNSDGKIYELKQSGGSWTYSLTVSGMNQVRSGTDMQVFNNLIFYVNTNHKICYIDFNGTNWVGGLQLVWTSTQNVKLNSQIIPTANHVYYIGDNNKVYDHVYANGWQGGSWPLDNNAPVVGANLSWTNHNNHLFYVGANNKIHELIWTSSNGWTGQELWLPNTNANTVRPDSKIKYFQNHIYYIGNNNQICDIIWGPTIGWVGGSKIYNGSSIQVRANSDFSFFNKILPVEGSLTGTTGSHHIFYTDVNGRVSYFIYDDVIRPFRNTNCTISNTDQWHYGYLKSTNNTVSTYFSQLLVHNEEIYYLDGNSKVNLMTRNPINDINKAGYNLTFHDEFDDNIVDGQNWGYQWPGISGHTMGNPSGQGKDKQAAFHKIDPLTSISDNITESNGIARIETREEEYDAIEWGWLWGMAWNNSSPCSTRTYDYTTGTLNTGGVNTHGYHCGPNSIPATMEQKYGYFEIRCKPPRGKDMWSAFWMLTEEPFIDVNDPCQVLHLQYPPEIDIFEIEGNGKVMLNNNIYRTYIPNCNCATNNNDCVTRDANGNQVNGLDSHKEYAVGYRYTEEYNVYALNWTPNKLEFIFNNEVIYTLTSNIPYVKMYLMINTYVNRHHVNPFAICEPEIFPNYYDIDYVRVYEKNSEGGFYEPEGFNKKGTEINSKKPEFNVYPNPSNGVITVSLPIDADESFSYEIYGVNGQLIKKGNSNSNSKTISIESKGMYLINIKFKDQSYTKSFVIE